MTQREFYHSAAWRRLARTFLLSRNCICERCGAPAVIVHHKAHLNPSNVDNPAISMNPDNLEALCLDCHNKEHFGQGGAILRGLSFDADGELIQTKGEDI
jgi:5-methylcytosine-specific restriction endonuclease McrA